MAQAVSALMTRSATALAFVLSTWLAGAAAPVMAQSAPGLRNPNVIVDYLEPRRPDDPRMAGYSQRVAAYERYMAIYSRMKERQVLEQFSQFMAPLRLPKTLRVRTGECGEINAYYSGAQWTITICYEWVDFVEQSAPQRVSDEGVTREEAIIGGFLGVLLHEAGHAISDILRLPVLGREEDSADEIAAFVMLQFGPDVARTAIKGTFYTWLALSRRADAVYWDEHSSASQRYANFLCIAYGADRETFNELAQKWLTTDRRGNCEQEYQQARNAFRKTVLPHVDQELMRQVQAMPVFRPGDGRW